jgi:hypothetical protein
MSTPQGQLQPQASVPPLPDLSDLSAKRWTIEQAPAVKNWYRGRYGKELPVTAFGESKTHERMGLDHRESFDVPLSPSSDEGRELINFLKSANIPHRAITAADVAAGVKATGEHIHVGEPSHGIGAPAAGLPDLSDLSDDAQASALPDLSDLHEAPPGFAVVRSGGNEPGAGVFHWIDEQGNVLRRVISGAPLPDTSITGWSLSADEKTRAQNQALLENFKLTGGQEPELVETAIDHAGQPLERNDPRRVIKPDEATVTPTVFKPNTQPEGVGVGAARAGAQWANNAPDLPAGFDVGDPIKVHVPAGLDDAQTYAALSDATLAALGPEAKRAGEEYRRATGRNLAQSSVSFAELVRAGQAVAVKDADGNVVGFDVTIAPKRHLVDVVNAINSGGLEAAHHVSADLAQQAHDYNRAYDERPQPGVVKQVIGDTVTSDAQTLHNVTSLVQGSLLRGSGMRAPGAGFDEWAAQNARDQELLNNAQASLPKAQTGTQQALRTVGDLAAKLPMYALAGEGAPLMMMAEAAHEGPEKMFTEGLKGAVTQGAGRAAKGLLMGLEDAPGVLSAHPVLANLAARTAQGGVMAAQGATEPEGRTLKGAAVNFGTGAIMPVGAPEATGEARPVERAPLGLGRDAAPVNPRGQRGGATVGEQTDNLIAQTFSRQPGNVRVNVAAAARQSPTEALTAEGYQVKRTPAPNARPGDVRPDVWQVTAPDGRRQVFTSDSELQAFAAAVRGNGQPARAAGGSLPDLSDLADAPLPATVKLQRPGRFRRTVSTALDLSNAPKTVMSAADLSAPGRQGLIFTLTHPVFAAHAMARQVKSLGSQKSHDDLMRWLVTHPDADKAERAGLYSAMKQGAKLSGREDAFMSRIAGRLPVVKQSERAYVAYLDSLRQDVFSKYAKQLERAGLNEFDNPEEFKSLARFINSATGRGELPKALEKFAPAMNAALFAPHNLKGRFDVLNPVYYARLAPAARKIAMKQMVQFAGTVTTGMYLAHLAGAKVTLNPSDPDFGKIVVGRAHYDFTGGHRGVIRLVAQLGQTFAGAGWGSLKDTGAKSGGVLLDFLRKNSAPVVNYAWAAGTGKEITGEHFEKFGHLYRNGRFAPGGGVIDRTMFFMLQDIADAWAEDGGKGVVKAAPAALFGVSVQTYEPKFKFQRGGKVQGETY